MRWTDIKKVKVTPKVGQVRVRKGFLFLPKKINHETRWLEKALWYEEYRFFHYEGCPSWVGVYGWVAVEWEYSE